jgi:hypothetical protein
VDSYDRRLALGAFGRHRHICAFFNGPDEEQRILRPFIEEGLIAGEKSLHLVDPHAHDDYVNRLRASKISVGPAMATGQLEIVPWDEAYTRGGAFNQDAMLSWFDERLTANSAKYPRTRVVAHMEWSLLDLPGVDDLLEYETRVNDVLGRYDAPVICAYDARKFSASIALDIMRTHPLIIIGGVLQENSFYASPDDLLAEIHESRRRRLPASPIHSPVISTA